MSVRLHNRFLHWPTALCQWRYASMLVHCVSEAPHKHHSQQNSWSTYWSAVKWETVHLANYDDKTTYGGGSSHICSSDDRRACETNASSVHVAPRLHQVRQCLAYTAAERQLSRAGALPSNHDNCKAMSQRRSHWKLLIKLRGTFNSISSKTNSFKKTTVNSNSKRVLSFFNLNSLQLTQRSQHYTNRRKPVA